MQSEERAAAGLLPAGLAEGTILKRPLAIDEPIGWRDVEFPEENVALQLWREQQQFFAPVSQIARA